MSQVHPIVQRRNTMLMVIRTVSLVALLVGAFSVLYPIGRALQLDFSSDALFAIWEWPAWFGLALATLLPGIGLMFVDRRIVR